MIVIFRDPLDKSKNFYPDKPLLPSTLLPPWDYAFSQPLSVNHPNEPPRPTHIFATGGAGMEPRANALSSAPIAWYFSCSAPM